MSDAISPPAYFEDIRSKAAKRWHQLEADPELAGPWYTLFQQVQYPRHVLSELMQNADDAGATEVAVRIEDGVFMFEHNGDDFKDEHFASLCRFAYSNKRNMHTIGFRGIGFKSTFSLGAEVHLYTPTLAVKFSEKRFTEPVWLEHAPDTHGKTRICVTIRDDYRQEELQNNLGDWSQSPFSLLFFNNLRRLHIGEKTVPWQQLGAGPARGSQWVTRSLSSKFVDGRYLLVKSEAEAFPADAMQEIRDERRMNPEDEDFPPCTVDIVLGAPGRIFVVLPTNVKTGLPFAVNAPFIQDPGRMEIKDPSISPTNRWLLRRIGRLAAETMLAWLAREDLSFEMRARAYDLLPSVQNSDGSLEKLCTDLVQEAFFTTIQGKAIILTDTGELVHSHEAVVLPKAILEVWDEDTPRLFSDARYALHRAVSESKQRQLKRLKLLDEVGKNTIFVTLRDQKLPKPMSWRKLASLWAYLNQEYAIKYLQALNIIPVAKQEILVALEDVVRPGDKALLEREEDWEFLTSFANIVDRDWIAYLLTQLVAAEQNANHVSSEQNQQLQGAYDLYRSFGLDKAESASDIISKISKVLFAERRSRDDYIRIAHIAAKLKAKVDETFCFVTQEGAVRSIKDHVLVDAKGELSELLLPQDRGMFLNDQYTREFLACSAQEWSEWVTSERTGVRTFIAIPQMTDTMYSRARARVATLVERRGYEGKIEPTYKRFDFVIEDYDFNDALWAHWETLAENDTQVWVRVVKHIMAQRRIEWRDSMYVRLFEQSNQGTRKPLISEKDKVVASWIQRLRDLPCLLDRNQQPQKPNMLYRRTPATEAFLQVETFVHSDFDKSLFYPLLDLLGVHSKPPSPERILSILRSFATQVDPKPHIVREVERWYDQLDDVVKSCSQENRTLIQQAFHEESLVLAQDGSWCSAGVVFLHDGDDIPGVSLVRENLKDLALWHQIGVSERPTVDLVVDWLQGLPSGETLKPADAKRVRSLLGRYPRDIWERCHHWLNLVDGWMPLTDMTFAITQESDVAWQHLFDSVTAKTADLRNVASDIVSNPPFRQLPTLASQLSQRIDEKTSASLHVDKKPWLEAFANHIARIIIFDNEDETEHVRSLAHRLMKTTWYNTAVIRVIPYLGNTPAGQPTDVDVLWQDTSLFVTNLSIPKLAKRLPKVLADTFHNRDILNALIYSVERSPQDIRAYLEENFTLVALGEVSMTVTDSGASLDTTQPRSQKEDKANQHLDERDDTRQVSQGIYDVISSFHPNDTATDAANDAMSNDAMPQPAHPPESAGRSGESHISDSGGVSFRLPSSKLKSVERDHEDHEANTNSHGRLTKTTLAMRFALAHGYQPVGNDGKLFQREDGHALKYVDDSTLFPWELTNTTGDVVCSYRPEVQCLDDDGITVLAEVWTLLDTQPDRYALILLDAEEEPLGVSGGVLSEEVDVHPASYRLVYNP